MMEGATVREQKRGKPDLEAVIKEAVTRSGLSLSELSRRSGVSVPQLSRFMADERTLTLTSASKLFDCLGLEVVAPPAPRKRRRAEGRRGE
jgi:transcriptional regulator with XRE-family HTH domain